MESLTMKDLNALIAECVTNAKAHTDSDYFQLEHRDGLWRAEAGPILSEALVGNHRTAFKGTGHTPENAVSMLLFSLGSAAPRN
jgi:hypothetical protein